MNCNILVTGANGQLGTVLVEALQHKYGKEHVIASGLEYKDKFNGIYEMLDVTDIERIREVVTNYNITQIYHLAAILSAKGEQDPLMTWEVNIKTLFNVLEVSRLSGVEKVFYPSSIAVFGKNVPQIGTPNYACLDPLTAYGMSKAAGENWCQYYFEKYGLDVRSVRYPGIIGYQSLPGGGTTDYAVDIYHNAVLGRRFSCFLKENTTLPMLFMEDAIRATLELMDAPKEKIRLRTSYNIAGISFSPLEVANEIAKVFPKFKIDYKPDYRQDIAEKWPQSIDDAEAKNDWGWKPEYDLGKITEIMLEKLQKHYRSSPVYWHSQV